MILAQSVPQACVANKCLCNSADGCPVTTIDPRNNMPLEPKQQPVPGQKKYISTYRLQSNIPKGGTETTWLYPSPQMFYNGMH